MRSRRLWVLASAVVAAIACEGDHDALKKKPNGSGGTGGGAGSAGAAGADAGEDAALDATADVFVEPPGENVLTLLHGVVDSKRIAFCFAKVVNGLPEPVLGAPLPSAGLTYGGVLAVKSPEGLDWAKDDVLPIVIAGDFSLLAGKSCAEAMALAQSFVPEAGAEEAGADADAGAEPPDGSATDASLDGDASSDAPADAPTELPPPPPVRAGELPVIPAGSFAFGWSLLFAATGCLGGPAFSDPLETWVCGASYKPSSPTLAPVLVPLSRVTKPGALGLQVVNAALASDPIDLTSVPPKNVSHPKIPIADEVVFGGVSPKPPLLDYSSSAFGSPISASTLEVTSQNSSSPFFTASWKDALDAGAIPEVKEGSTYALVLIGPRPNNLAAKWWNGPKIVALKP